MTLGDLHNTMASYGLYNERHILLKFIKNTDYFLGTVICNRLPKPEDNVKSNFPENYLKHLKSKGFKLYIPINDLPDGLMKKFYESEKELKLKIYEKLSKNL